MYNKKRNSILALSVVSKCVASVSVCVTPQNPTEVLLWKQKHKRINEHFITIPDQSEWSI